MDEAESATKALGLDEPRRRAGSDTESDPEVSTMAVMAAPENIDMEAEAMPNPDDAESAFAGKGDELRASRVALKVKKIAPTSCF